MRRYRGSSLKIDWEDEELLKNVSTLIDQVTEQVASTAVNIAQKLVRVDTGTLRSEIEMTKSRLSPGTWIVEAQGPGNYSEFYATFLELGHHSSQGGRFTRNKNKIKAGTAKPMAGGVWVPGHPFMRPTLKRIRRIMRKSMKDAIGDVSAG